MIVLDIAACTVVGLLAGSWLLEALVLVPFWRTMDTRAFFDLYAGLGPWIYRYFAPLTAIAVILSIAAAIAPIATGSGMQLYANIAAGLMIGALVMFVTFFKQSIADFKAGVESAEGLARDLQRWARWHTVRVIIGLTAFCSAAINIVN